MNFILSMLGSAVLCTLLFVFFCLDKWLDDKEQAKEWAKKEAERKRREQEEERQRQIQEDRERQEFLKQAAYFDGHPLLEALLDRLNGALLVDLRIVGTRIRIDVKPTCLYLWNNDKSTTLFTIYYSDLGYGEASLSQCPAIAYQLSVGLQKRYGSRITVYQPRDDQVSVFVPPADRSDLKPI